MIESFGNKAAKDIWEKDYCRAFPEGLHERAKALLTIMHAVNNLEELKVLGQPPSLRLQVLKGDRKGDFAIDINKISGWRITFIFERGSFRNVKIEDYH